MKSPILFELSEIKDLFDAFKEFLRTKGVYEEHLDHLKMYDTSFFRLVIKSNQTKKRFKLRKHDLLGKSRIGVEQGYSRPTDQKVRFYHVWGQNNDVASLTPVQIRFKNRYINVLGNVNQLFKDVRIFLSPEALIQAKTDDVTPFNEVPVKNPHAIEELVYLAETYDEFVSQYQGKKTQENFNIYFKNQFLVNVLSPYFRQSMAEPIIKIMEQTRRLLSETLLKHFRPDILARQSELNDTLPAENFLKNNKDEIFEIAQRVGVIENAQKLIQLHQLRDRLSHPDINMDVLVDVPSCVNDIYETILSLIRRITTTKNLSVKKVPSLMTVDDVRFVIDVVNNCSIKDCIPIVEKNKDIETPTLIHAMQCLDIAFQSINIVDSNGKPLKGKKQCQWLVDEGIISDTDKQDYETAKTLRNTVCHGNATPQTHTDIVASNTISQQLTQKIIQNINQKTV
ncbi:MAG: hypothetical protein IJY58_03200 [Alphaproteobacteria bacterium]|nr:hypothetical protein [Alphaproteobacteria bacterium]